MAKFKSGVVLGGILGAGIAWLSLTKEGRKKRDELLDRAAELYEQVKRDAVRSPEWKNMKKNRYVEMVREAVDRYAVKTGLADSAKKAIASLIEAQWVSLKKEMRKKN